MKEQNLHTETEAQEIFSPFPLEETQETFSPLSLEEAKELLKKHANQIVDTDDPVMLSVLLHQGFMADYEKLLALHQKAINQFMKQNAVKWATEISESLAVLKEESLQASLQNILAVTSQKATENSRLDQRIRSHGKALWLATGLTWLAVITLYFILT